MLAADLKVPTTHCIPLVFKVHPEHYGAASHSHSTAIVFDALNKHEITIVGTASGSAAAAAAATVDAYTQHTACMEDDGRRRAVLIRELVASVEFNLHKAEFGRFMAL